MSHDAWFVGAYALTASLPSYTAADARNFYAELQDLPHIGGLELPVHRLEKADDPWRHLELLPRQLDYILTPLPEVMQTLEKQPLYGLGSADAEGRRAALQAVLALSDRIKRLEDHCGRPAVRAVELHSAPTGKADAASLRLSLEALAQTDWGRVELWLEHCDSPRADHAAAKGFLDLENELRILQDLRLGLNINWGRSAVETRSADGANAQVKRAHEAGVLRGLFFSSTAVNDAVYGDWQDNHAPMQWEEPRLSALWMPEGSLLTVTEAQKALVAAGPDVLRGIKVQPAPASLPLTARLECVRQHLITLQALARSGNAGP